LALVALLACLAAPAPAARAEAPRLIAASYPVWLFARYLALGRDRFRVELLTNPGTGCPHDFAPQPRDLERLSQARALVKNGLNLEPYLDRAMKVASQSVLVVDASRGLPTLSLSWGRLDLGGGGPRATDDLSPLAPNPHVFSSPRLAGLMARNVANGLAEADPEGADHYLARLLSFQADMDYLGDLVASFERSREGYRLIVSHGFMDYLARDMGLIVLADIEPAPEAAPSAARLKALADLAKAGEVNAILAEPAADLKVARALAAEGRVPAAIIDPVTAGPADPEPDYYKKVMRENIAVLARLLPANRPAGGR
jgi:ABC-type Zn uptake system ZnuABC Zn-binding protein ZnuA